MTVILYGLATTDVIARSEATRQSLSGCSGAERSRATESRACRVAVLLTMTVILYELAITLVLSGHLVAGARGQNYYRPSYLKVLPAGAKSHN